MDIRVTSRHSKLSDDLKDTITEKLNRLERYYDRITSCRVILDSESVEKSMEVVLGVQNNQIRAMAKADNIGKALDNVLEKTERQLKRINERVKKHNHRPVK